MTIHLANQGSNPSDGEMNGDDDDDEDGEVRQSSSKRQKLDPAEMVMRRREKRLWHEKRKEILFNYMQFSFYSSSVSSTKYLISKFVLYYLLPCTDCSSNVRTCLEIVS